MIVTFDPPPVWQAAMHDPVALATVLLAFVTGGLWIFTGLLWRATVRLAKEAKESAVAQGEKMERSVLEAAAASKAMQRQNELTESGQRAWIRIGAEPKLVCRYGADGLYLRMDFVAENIGKSPATHFELEHAVLFQGQHEVAAAFEDRIRDQIAKWKEEYSTGPRAVLAPNDTQTGGIWDSYDGDVVNWWDLNIGFKTAHPVLLAAVLYRTTSAPQLVQMSWRTWYLVGIDEDGDNLGFIPFPDGDLGPNKLRTEPRLASMAHEEFEPAPQDKDREAGPSRE